MKITRLQLEDTQSVPPMDAASISPGLNLISLESSSRGSQVIDLLTALLYGRESRRWDRQIEASGSVDVSGPLGRFQLRRRREADGGQRLTVASLEGREAPQGVIESLLHNLPAEVANKVFHANGRRGDQLSELLSESVAQAFQHIEGQTPCIAGELPARSQEATRASHAELLDHRDQLASRIERSLSERRGRSGELDAEIQDIDAELDRLANRREQVDRQRMSVESRLSAIEAGLRFAAISETIHRESDRADLEQSAPQLDELDQQIERWRNTLAELELRESSVRSQLASIHPDDASPSITLADQRAGLAVAGRLLQDLEGEVARLARAADSQSCVCRDAHPRINPLVETLAQQVARLTDLAKQQQRAFEAQQLKAEAEHLSRSQSDLQRQIEHLLTRRQEIYRATRAKRGSGVDVSENLGYEPQGESRVMLETEMAELERELAGIEHAICRNESRRKKFYQQRAELLSSTELDALQSELADLQRRLRESPTTSAEPSPDRTNRWRASELFARLTDGQWVTLRLVMGGRELAATDRYGTQRLARELSSSERRLAALSLRLSLAWTAAQRGIALPLVLDEPFAGLEADQSSRLATLLDDYGRSGRQVFVSTDDAGALHRFATLGAAFVGTHQAPSSVEFEPEVSHQPVTRSFTRTVTTSRVASDYLLSPEDGIDRFPVPIRDRQAVFSRSRIRTIADLLGADPSAVAEELDRDDVTAELVALWQTHLAFVCFVPHTSFDDALALTGAGCYCPLELAEIAADDLSQRLRGYLDSDRGRRLRERGYSINRDHAVRMIDHAKQGRARWRDSDAWSGWRRRRGERRQRAEQASAPRGGQIRLRTDTARRGTTNSSTRSRGKAGSKPSKLRFYLEISSPIVDAPSIGPKTAKKLEKVGIRTVADLIEADPELLAEKLESARISGETLVAWQHQAQLVCRIPGLRGHDAQVLVACGFTRPEEISSMKPAELFGFVEPFSSSEEGQRTLRNNRTPDLAEVTDWVNWSRQCRVLGAA